MNALRAIYRYVISILAAAVVVQIAFAGYGAFYAADKVSDTSINEDIFNEGFDPHIALGYMLFPAALIAVVVALIARPGKRTVLLTVGAAVLFFLQIVLAQIGEGTPVVGALHPINAFLILGLVGTLAGSQWRARKMGMSSGPAPGGSPAP
jgi:hypothetical protein